MDWRILLNTLPPPGMQWRSRWGGQIYLTKGRRYIGTIPTSQAGCLCLLSNRSHTRALIEAWEEVRDNPRYPYYYHVPHKREQ